MFVFEFGGTANQLVVFRSEHGVHLAEPRRTVVLALVVRLHEDSLYIYLRNVGHHANRFKRFSRSDFQQVIIYYALSGA